MSATPGTYPKQKFHFNKTIILFTRVVDHRPLTDLRYAKILKKLKKENRKQITGTDKRLIFYVNIEN